MMMAAPETSSAGQLRARLGKGARQDAPGSPADVLRIARHGMAFFARQLNNLSDQDLARPSLIAGWQRSHVVAHVGIEARRQALALAALRGQPPEDDFDLSGDVEFAASLPPRALRHLFEHAHVHVNVEWRDLSQADWERGVTFDPSMTVAARDLPARQAALLWWGAVALNAAATMDEFPRGVGTPQGPLQALARGRPDKVPPPDTGEPNETEMGRTP